MSRIAIHARPMWPRTRFLASSVNTISDARAEQVLLDRRVDRPAEQFDRRRRHRARRRVVGEPLDAQRTAQSMKNCAASVATARYRPLMRSSECRTATPTSGGDARRRAPARSGSCSAVDADREVVGRVGADRHEGAGAERDLAAVADQDVQADAPPATGSGTGSGSAREQVSLRQQRHDDEGERRAAPISDAVLRDRKDLLVGAVAGS